MCLGQTFNHPFYQGYKGKFSEYDETFITNSWWKLIFLHPIQTKIQSLSICQSKNVRRTW